MRVRIPSEYEQVLRAPLAARGVGLAEAMEPAAAVMSRSPVFSAPWLAVVDDEVTAAAVIDAGAADAVLPTVAPDLLAARLVRLARPALLRIGTLTIDPLARVAWRGGRLLTLLPREYAVLLQLARQADTVVSRAALRLAVWGRDFDPGTNVIEVHVSRLRAQLDRDAPPMLRTERGLGYRLATDADIAERKRAS